MSKQVIRNFSAGPAILPPVVFERASEAIRELRKDGHAREADGTGLSILEISHRSADYEAINSGATRLCHEVLGIPETHQVLFLQGGASLQFVTVPMNLRQEGKPACYVDTGNWSEKAIIESRQLGETRVIASSEASKHDHIPELPSPEAYAGASYVHITSNNTVRGTEYAELPALAGDVPLVIDCSSHIGSRPMALSRVGLGYAGAQKNLGPSGVTLVFVRKDLLERAPAGVVPKYLRYATHAKKPSLYNTPNTFGVLVLKLMLEWLRDQGGVAAMGVINQRKAKLLYDVLEDSSLYTPHARPGSRSLMNVTWTLGGVAEGERDAMTKRLVAAAADAGLRNLKGHRTVGGLRASIYNAFPEQGVRELCEFLREFERTA